MEEPNVLIGMPNYTNLMSSEVYANHIDNISHWNDIGLKFKLLVVGRTFVHFARTQVCQVAVDSQNTDKPYTHVFWLDDDALIPVDLLPKFINHDKDVMIAPYPMRRSPFQIGVLSAMAYICETCDHEWYCDDDITPPDTLPCPECGQTGFRDFHNMKSYKNLGISDMDQGVISIDGGGTHAQLWKTDVLLRAGDDQRAMSPRLKEMMDTMTVEELQTLEHTLGELPSPTLSFKEEDEMGKSYFTMPKTGTEDMLWCYRAKCKGIQVHCDTDIFANHVGFAPVITRQFTESAENKERNGQVELLPSDGRNHNAVNVNTATSLV